MVEVQSQNNWYISETIFYDIEVDTNCNLSQHTCIFRKITFWCFNGEKDSCFKNKDDNKGLFGDEYKIDIRTLPIGESQKIERLNLSMLVSANIEAVDYVFNIISFKNE